MPTLTESQVIAIGEIQRKVRAISMSGRPRTGKAQFRGPSRYWTDFCACFDYMIDMAPRSFAKLRLHTYHLTGDNYQTYYFGNRAPVPRLLRPVARNRRPPARTRSERARGRDWFPSRRWPIFSADIARFQRSVSTLSRQGVLARLIEPALIEIGGGYGGLALHLSRIVGKSHYVIVDLPETLDLFSGLPDAP